MTQVDMSALILRLTIGSIMIVHGLAHAVAGAKIAGTARWFESVGLRPGKLHAVAAVITETLAGVLLLLGALTPLASAAVVATMMVAVVTVHGRNGFFIYRPGQGWEYVACLGAATVALAASGPGRWSIDHRFSSVIDGGRGAGVAVCAGTLAAGLVLMLFWRPTPAIRPHRK